MIGPVQCARTQVLVGLVQVAVTRDEDAVAVLEKRARIHELAVAVDNQARVVLHYGRHAEALGELLGQRTGADIDREVATPRKRVEPHIAERLGEAATGMVADEDNRRVGEGIKDTVRTRLIGSQQRMNDAWVWFACHGKSA